MKEDIFNDRAIPVTFRSDGDDDDDPNHPIGEIHNHNDGIIYDGGIIYEDQENTIEEEDDMMLSIDENSVEEMMLATQEDDMILSIEVNVIEEMMLPTQEEFNINVKSNVLTSTDPTESLADRLDKISTPSQSLTASF